MIVSHLSQLSQQVPSHLGIQKALAFLAQVQGQELPDGRIEIDEKRVYALVQSYTSKPETANPRFEAHRRYVDVQYLVSGKEAFGWAPLDALQEATPYNDEKDVLHGRVAPDRTTLVQLTPGLAAIVYPEDAHAPGLAAGEPAPVKKIVVKVAL